MNDLEIINKAIQEVDTEGMHFSDHVLHMVLSMLHPNSVVTLSEVYAALDQAEETTKRLRIKLQEIANQQDRSLHKLNRVEILQLLPQLTDATEVYVRLYRLWEPEPKVIWQGKTTLYKDVRPLSKKQTEVFYISISPRFDDGWAEYDQNDLSDDGFVVEDYLMEIWG